MNKYIVVALLFIIFYTLVNYLIYNYKKTKIVEGIIDEWKTRTNGGYIEVDKRGNYKNDLYLSMSNFENGDSHIHLITNKPGKFIGYVVKKYDLHSREYFYDETTSPTEIVNEMLENIHTFKY